MDYTSTKDENHMDLSLDVRGCHDLLSSLRQYLAPETLEGENQYHPEGHSPQDAIKGVMLQKVSPILNVHLKRFMYDPQSDSVKKVHDRFEFPFTLNLSEFLPNTVPEEHTTYTLHAVVVHSGIGSGGHYYSYVRANCADHDWQLCNDSQQVRASREEVCRAFGAVSYTHLTLPTKRIV
eukprot:TRINITY_DN26098_c0_g1_i1.p2 TRINITY_DN26098_c0_g1~~TRINITY_DN26098_c0_g1_i1.p2  ORF type:complete len:179 (-),score=42.76 TRINITY_DN26098_c0_g1_i1:102-638(-)